MTFITVFPFVQMFLQGYFLQLCFKYPALYFAQACILYFGIELGLFPISIVSLPQLSDGKDTHIMEILPFSFDLEYP